MRFLNQFANRLPALPTRAGAATATPRSYLNATVAIAVVALSLGACTNPRTSAELTTGSIDNDYHLRHPIVLAESAETLDIPVGEQSAGLTPRMAHTIEVFAQNARNQGARGITILIPSGSVNAAAAHRVAGQVAAALAQGGIPRAAISRSPYQVDDGTADAPLRIAYARMKAMVTHACGTWPKPVATGNEENIDDWDLGCATQTNLAAMVANPEDLVTPTGEDPADSTRRTTIITKYRAGTQTKAETGAKATSIADGVQGGN